jgi:para-aminobenzoate synthetase / 4-amino-4-deoxychorismate lyase
MRSESRARLVRIPLDGSVSAERAALLVRGDARPFALTGAWAGGGALVGSEPARVADAGDDPFALLDEQPEIDAGADAGDSVGGGWFGYLGYSLGATLEPVPPSPPRPAPLPAFSLGFYDHLLRLDRNGRWWFEALWTDEREAALEERLARLSGRLSAGVRDRAVWVSGFGIAPPGAAGHLEAVAECRERIAAGEIFQANICLRLDGHFEGNPADLFARATEKLQPRHAAYLRGPWGAVVSLSPELFLRRRGREVVTEPIKGTAPPDAAGRERLTDSLKDRAENVMIVDLMRSDLGRVCEYGSVSVPELTAPREAPGVWHLVSSVAGTLRPDVGDTGLVRATFPPGSVTGAPKIQTMRVIAELEAGGREIYTGAIGYSSPVAGLELNVAIRTLEISGDRIWIGAGGGITAGSDPQGELAESLLKARPVIEAAGGRLNASPATTPPRPARRMPRALDGGADRPDPALGVFTTMLASAGRVLDLDSHLARLNASVRALYGAGLSAELEGAVLELAGAHPQARLRVRVRPGPGPELQTEMDAAPLAFQPPDGTPAPVVLAPALLPGGLGEHKWIDRRLLGRLEEWLGAVPLLVDLDGQVLEAAWANVWIVEGDRLITPPLDGRQLPGSVRARILSSPPEGLVVREEAIALERLAAADELLLSSSVGRLTPAALTGREARFAVGARVLAEASSDPSSAAPKPPGRPRPAPASPLPPRADR